MNKTKELPVLEVNGKKFDLGKAWPLRWKDLKALRNLGATDEKMQSGDTEALGEFFLYILKLTNETADGHDVDELTVHDIAKLTDLMDIRDEVGN